MTEQPLAGQSAAILSSGWRTEPNLELGDVRIVADTPDGPKTVAELLLYGQQVAEHIAGLHNQFVDGVDPDVYADNRRLAVELVEERRQREAVDNQVAALVREVKRLQHAETRAVRYALEKDREVAEVDAKLAARDAEIARLNAREAATQVNLYDANLDVEDLRSRLKATSDAYNDAENRLHTKTEVARGNKRHVAVLTEVIERVEKFADEMDNYCSPHGVAAEYADRLREVLHAPTSVEKAGRMPGMPGDRVEDGGVMGTLVRCETCGGDGLLHKPDQMPPAVAPQECPQPVREPDGCPEPVWDGPYKMRCGLGASGGVCGRHGRFRFPYGDEKPSP